MQGRCGYHGPVLYERLLGSAWLQVAEPIRSAHTTGSPVQGHGNFRIRHGEGHLARVLARLLRLPRAGDAIETRLVVASHGDGEQWLRRFGDRRLDTVQYEGDGELVERIGVLEFRFRLDASGGSLLYRQHDVALVLGSLRLRLPAGWAPMVEAREDPAAAHQVRVQVLVSIPAVGPVLAYDGIIQYEGTPR
jgi:hypothetical protein